MNLTDIQKTLSYLYSFEKFGISLGLHKIKALLEPFGNPQDKLKVIHIAGTNGKGSTAVIIESILLNHGFKVGLYTSPHLIRFNERIRINKKEISDEEIVELTLRLKPVADRIKLKDPITFFDFTTAMAYLHFYEKNVDYAIMEVGLGGRLDSTNIVKKPILVIITNISKEHEQYLGNSIEKITKEKCGIIKDNSKVVTCEDNEKVLEIIKKEAKLKNAMVFPLKKFCSVKIKKNFYFDYYGPKYSFKNLKSNLFGLHQVKNSCCGIFACEIIDDFKLEECKVKNALLNIKWNGRFEILKKEPLFVVDGAHNPDGAKVLAENLKMLKFNKLILILSIMSDKNIEGIFKQLVPLADEIILTKAEIERAESIEKMENILKKFNKKAYTFENLKDAVNFSLEIADKNDLICFTGSLYAVGDLKKYHEKNAIFD